MTDLAAWANKWRLTLAEHKCVYTIFTKKQTIDDLKLILNNKQIAYDECPKFLGIFLDSKLDFSSQINYFEEKCNDRMGVLKALSFGQFKLPFHVMKALYKSLIRSLMEYSSFLVNMLNAKLINKLQVIQNNCLRIICKRDMFSHTSIEELNELASTSMVKERLNKMNRKFIANNIANNNPLITSLARDFVEFTSKCHIKNIVVGPTVLTGNEDIFTLENA